MCQWYSNLIQATSRTYLQVFKLNTSWSIHYVQSMKKEITYSGRMEWFRLKWTLHKIKDSAIYISCLDDPFQKVLLNHLFNFLPHFARECLLVLHFDVFVGKRVWVKHGAPWMANAPAGDFAVEDLAQDMEEGEELLNAADSTKGQEQVAGFPVQNPPWAVLLWIFL